jgi:hypothetical protein
VHTLLKGLEKIAVSADIPMLVCGDFNSVPGRFDLLLLLDTHVLQKFLIRNLFLKIIFSDFVVVLLMHFLQWVR